MSDREIARSVLEIIPLTMGFIRREVRHISKSKLPLPHYRIVAYLARKPTVTNRQLAEWQGVSFPAMSRMVDGLVRRGLLHREKSSEDRREIQLALTSKGRHAYSKVREVIEGKLVERLEKLPPRQKELLGSGLEVLEGILGEISGEP